MSGSGSRANEAGFTWVGSETERERERKLVEKEGRVPLRNKCV